jgi:hypothetical protein
MNVTAWWQTGVVLVATSSFRESARRCSRSPRCGIRDALFAYHVYAFYALVLGVAIGLSQARAPEPEAAPARRMAQGARDRGRALVLLHHEHVRRAEPVADPVRLRFVLPEPVPALAQSPP